MHTTSIITTNRTKEMLPITDPVMTAMLSFGIVAVVVLVVAVVVVVAVPVVINFRVCLSEPHPGVFCRYERLF